VESSNPVFAKAIVRINVFRNHRQVGHLPSLLMSYLRHATGIVVGAALATKELPACLPAAGKPPSC
jgi:hypothetical protein